MTLIHSVRTARCNSPVTGSTSFVCTTRSSITSPNRSAAPAVDRSVVPRASIRWEPSGEVRDDRCRFHPRLLAGGGLECRCAAGAWAWDPGRRSDHRHRRRHHRRSAAGGRDARDCPTVSWTSGKSVHRIYRWDPRLPQVANMTVSGLEFRFGGRGKETQSVAPPSAHKSGRRYMFVEGRNLEQIAIARLPDHVIEWICERYAEQANSPSGSPSSADYRRFRTPGKKIQEPGRNNALVRFANSAPAGCLQTVRSESTGRVGGP